MPRFSAISHKARRLYGVLLALVLATIPALSTANIIWSGDFETGNFIQWHSQNDSALPHFSAVPVYGRPKNDTAYGSQRESYYGDGSLLEIVTNPVRQGRYAAKFTVKNSANGREPDDCDTDGKCNRRRTELTVQATLPRYYNAMPYMTERWMSVSHYVPANWDDRGSGAGPTVFQVKPLNETGLSPTIAIEISNGTWAIWHRWSDIKNPSPSDVPWQQQMFYAGNEGGQPYPRANFWPEGMADFPDVATSHAALKSLNKGGWTDWIIHVKYDARGSRSGGTGFLTVWKREDSGPWIKLLHILPKRTERGGKVFDHGIGYYSPARGDSNPGGFGIKAGMYMQKGQVWDLPRNRVMYHDNIKVGDRRSVFSIMSPDGSSPGAAPSAGAPPPAPPVLERIE